MNLSALGVKSAIGGSAANVLGKGTEQLIELGFSPILSFVAAARPSCPALFCQDHTYPEISIGAEKRFHTGACPPTPPSTR